MSLRRKAAVVVVASSMIVPAAYSLSAEGPSHPMQPAAQQMHEGQRALHKSERHHKAVRSERTKEIQEALNKHGSGLKVDGMFGRETRAALEKFQKENGLKPTGKADKVTLAKLEVTAPAPAKRMSHK